MNIKVLVAEDDSNLGTILSEYLSAKGYEVELCRDGEEAYQAFVKHSFDFCILDVMMPVKDGFTLAKQIRKVNKQIPIIFLTAKSMKEDTLEGFKSGADDYITKPFSMEELLVRMKAIIRRSLGDTEDGGGIVSIGSYEFDYQKQSLKIADKIYKLTSKENDLLKLLSNNINDVLDRTYALKAIWEDDSYFNSRSMDVYITKLRKHLKEDDSIEIVNVHGKGFKLLINKN